MPRWTYIFLMLVALVYALSHCQPQSAPRQEQKGEEAYVFNPGDYVGIETCQQCHAGVHSTFVQTGMGRSLGDAHPDFSRAHFQRDSLLYDDHLDFYYYAQWQGKQLFLTEFRLDSQGDTSHKRRQRIDYIIGSGQHTNSHLWEEEGFLFQAPFTWYAQEGRLDFPPGYEGGQNSRFSRIIGLECMSCHNATPKGFSLGSENHFRHLPKGIDCERCHGPGAAHVAKIQAGDITDTAREADPSIVNPKRLSAQLQFEICQRCHLQGNAVLKRGKSFFDFIPGMELSEVMSVYLPRYRGGEDQFIMASHADRFKLSDCYQAYPEKFTCTSCHNPHLSVRETKVEGFNQTCQNCHSGAPRHQCSAPLDSLQLRKFNCVDCHMPSSATTDIPHVTVHDHYIRKPKGQPTRAQAFAESDFMGLVAINEEAPSARAKALAYLQQFERFEARAFYLDSAYFFLQKLSNDHPERLRLWTYYYFLGEDYRQLRQWAEAQGGTQLLNHHLQDSSWDNASAWTAYRLGEAYARAEDWPGALAFFGRATSLAPLVPEFWLKQASAEARAGDLRAAELSYRRLLQLRPSHREGLNNYAFLLLQSGRPVEAASYLERVLSLHPDYEMAWLNRAQSAALLRESAQLRRALQEVLRINPQNQRAQEALASLRP